MSSPSSAFSSELTGLNPAGLLLGALGEATASWPQEGPVAWQPPEAEEAAALFPGYAEVSFLGRGGMGAVYAARQTSLDRRVALKLLPAELSRNPAAAERFRREARSLARLDHPNIVGVHDFGETPDGSFFIVMEHVEGSDLHRLIRDGGLPLPRVLNIMRQVCDALEYAHAQGFVHRDIKPANILLDTAGRVKVSDFGLARLVGEDTDAARDPAPTMTSGIVGTPDYIAPEQRAGDRPVDHRADIYSLGVMFYEMLTGSVPRGAFEPPSRRAAVDQQMDRVVLRAMQEEPDKRYQHAAEVKSGVDRAARRPALRRWLRAAALVVCALGAAAVWQFRAGSHAGVPAAPAMPKEWRNDLGMKFLPSGTPGVMMAATETKRSEFETFANATQDESAGPVFFPRDGRWDVQEGSWHTPPGVPPQTGDHAVVAVTSDEAAAFCAWLTQRGLESGELKKGTRYRLPTAAEWARAAGLPLEIGTHRARPDAFLPTGLTGQSAPAADGFLDLHSNIVEWTGSGGSRAGDVLACGTGWADQPRLAPVSALARPYHFQTRGVVLGFRVVLDLTALSLP